MSDPQNPQATPDDPAKAEPGQAKQEPAAEPLGEAGKKALEAERSARKQAETDLSALRSEFEGFKSSLSQAIGVKSDEGEADTLQQVQNQLAQMQHETAVFRLAAQHQITDDGDLDLLKSATDVQAMSKLAERLAAKANESTPGTPKPDATQGGAGAPPALNSDGLEQALMSKLGI